MSTYRVETEDGTFDVEVDDGSKAPSSNEGLDLLKNIGVGGPSGISFGSKKEDLPFIAATSLDQFLTGGQVTTALEQPKEFGLGGPSLANFAQGANLLPSILGEGEVFKSTGVTKAPTASGRATQTALGIAIPGGKAISMAKSSSFRKPSSMDVLDMVDQAKYEQSALDTVIGRQEVSDIASLRSLNQNKISAIKNEIVNIDKDVIPVAADKATLSGRPTYMKWAKDLSDRYGAEYEPLIRGKSTTLEKYQTALGEAESSLGTQNIDTSALSGPDKVLRGELERINKLINEHGWEKARNLTMRLDEIDDILKKGIFKGNFGKMYTYGDRAITEARKSLTNLLKSEIKELVPLNAKYAPELQFKNEAFNIFQPFSKSGSFDTTRGINFFQRYATGKLKPDEMRFVDIIKKNFDPNFTGELDSAVSQKKLLNSTLEGVAKKESEDVLNIKMGHDFERAKSQMENEKHLAFLDSMLAETKKSESLKLLRDRVGLGAAGTAGAGFLSKIGYDFAKVVTPNE